MKIYENLNSSKTTEDQKTSKDFREESTGLLTVIYGSHIFEKSWVTAEKGQEEEVEYGARWGGGCFSHPLTMAVHSRYAIWWRDI